LLVEFDCFADVVDGFFSHSWEGGEFGCIEILFELIEGGDVEIFPHEFDGFRAEPGDGEDVEESGGDFCEEFVVFCDFAGVEKFDDFLGAFFADAIDCGDWFGGVVEVLADD